MLLLFGGRKGCKESAFVPARERCRHNTAGWYGSRGYEMGWALGVRFLDRGRLNCGVWDIVMVEANFVFRLV